jgi:hypothetical protein
MSLLGLPDELISNICEQVQEIIPKLRLTCRQLQAASFHSFLTCYFTELAIYSHPASVGVLLEITNDVRFAKAVRSLEIDHDGVFTSAYSVSHHDLIEHGIIRKQLTKALSRLPNCTTIMKASWGHCEWGDFQRLGCSLIESSFEERQVWSVFGCGNGDRSSFWLSDAGLCYPSYVTIDIIAAVTSCTNAVQAIRLSDYNHRVELAALADYLKLSFDLSKVTAGVKYISIDMSDFECTDQDVMPFIREYLPKLGSPSEMLGNLLVKFPGLQKLNIHQNHMDAGAFFPSMLPNTLRELSFHDDNHTDAAPQAILRGLRDLTELRELDLCHFYLEDVDQCRYVLRAVSKLPALKTLRMCVRHCHAPDRKDLDIDYCFQPCTQDVKHKYFTENVKNGLPQWIMAVNLCTC